MFYFQCRTRFLHVIRRQTIKASQSYQLLYSPSVSKLSSTLILRFISTASNQHSFTVSYLIEKCELSPEKASRVSTLVHFETPDKPDSFIAFLKKHGFSKTQITNLIQRCPKLLTFDAEKTVLPKLEFLYSIGFSRPDNAKLLSGYPRLLCSSLEKRIIPSFTFLRDLLQSNDDAIKAIKRFTGILDVKLESHLFPNINVLRRYGVPESNIARILLRQPRTLMYNHVRFKESVEEVKRMGFDSSKMVFIQAAIVLKSMTKSTLEKKFDVYRRWGWSDQQIFEAFQKHPSCMSVSEDKIMVIMDFLVNKVGFNSTLVVKQPKVLCGSVEKKIVPRALFLQDLLSQGLINELKLSVIDGSEEKFRRKFLYSPANKASELLKLYEEKLNISEKNEKKSELM